MRYGIAVGLWMVALGACQVATLPQVVDGRVEQSAAEHSQLFDRGALTVMTRSLSGGTPLERLLEGPLAEEPARAAELLGALSQEDVRARARKLADEIQYARPHLIGLQQVTQVRLQSPGDALFGGTQPAEAMYLDVLPVLLGELEARGLHYREVARVRNADVELPLLTSSAPTFDDVRLTDFDLILARADVEIKEARAGNYVAHREVSRPGQEPVALPRGWVSVAAKVEGRKYRFVSTHLEPAPDETGLRVQVAQAGELIRTLRGEPLPVVLVGDFNTPANLGLMGAPTYRELLLAGYVDVWTRRQGGLLPVGADLPNEMPALAERLNLVLVRKPVAPSPRRMGPVLAYVVGGSLEERFGPWKSDLAGVVARLRI
ncbi:endonuclease/exonuclease/phosphatase family protein [Archangium lansingense]|uniref:Endonuclease/exonuclease/phosphatase family protein n=1 Tax=Archangium lansingense TaxID=2995310 RepID=A0ABT4A8F8_9BACT|nr:endonuclease/exonuclease/phosphatase family protein [Archangium lansinium]MCY1077938.1 endonuclease/exonuclease/phosphatase family protein [Archangium lansinium]